MWLSIAADIIVVSFTDNAANSFKEIVIVVNGKVHPEDTLCVLFRIVGLSGFRASPTCVYLQYHTHKHAGCRYGVILQMLALRVLPMYVTINQCN